LGSGCRDVGDGVSVLWLDDEPICFCTLVCCSLCVEGYFVSYALLVEEAGWVAAGLLCWFLVIVKEAAEV